MNVHPLIILGGKAQKPLTRVLVNVMVCPAHFTEAQLKGGLYLLGDNFGRIANMLYHKLGRLVSHTHAPVVAVSFDDPEWLMLQRNTRTSQQTSRADA